MVARTIEVSGEDAKLNVRKGQLHITRGNEEVGKIPIEDIGILIIDTPTASYTHGTIVQMVQNGGVVVFCGDDHIPAAITMPVVGHHVQSERFRMQVEMTEPVRKRIWTQIVREKILRQKEVCEDAPARAKLDNILTRLKLGDPENTEAQAARAYWGVYLPGTDFRRARDGRFPNNLLNYGYMIMRAAVARSIIASGFHPSLGLQHTNRYNAFCLADDLMEPLRPLIDLMVRRLYRNKFGDLDRTAKRTLLSLLEWPTETEAGTGPLLNGLEGYCASLHRVLAKKQDLLDIPKPLPPRPPALTPPANA